VETNNPPSHFQQISQSGDEVTRLNLTNDTTPMWGVVRDLTTQRTNGARWFYWVGGLSLVNAIIVAANGHWNFLAGLGITQIISGFALGLSEQFGVGVTVIAFALNLMVVVICMAFGYFAERGHAWAFITGMVLYALDALIFLWVQDWFALGFHGFALYGMYRGLSANLKLGHLKTEVGTVG